MTLRQLRHTETRYGGRQTVSVAADLLMQFDLTLSTRRRLSIPLLALATSYLHVVGISSHFAQLVS